MKILLFIASVAPIFLLTACTESSARLDALEQQVHTAQASADSNRMALLKLGEITHATNEWAGKYLGALEFMQEQSSGMLDKIYPESTAYQVTPDGGGFQIYESQLGKVIITTEKVEPYLDGYKASLRIGNPSGASFSGAHVKVEWGQYVTNHYRANAYIFGREHSRTNVYATTYAAAAWTRQEIIITPCTADELRGAKLQFTFDLLSLAQPN